MLLIKKMCTFVEIFHNKFEMFLVIFIYDVKRCLFSDYTLYTFCLALPDFRNISEQRLQYLDNIITNTKSPFHKGLWFSNLDVNVKKGNQLKSDQFERY